MPFLPSTFTDSLVSALRSAFVAAREALPDETFYGYAIYTSSGYRYLVLVLGISFLGKARSIAGPILGVVRER